MIYIDQDDHDVEMTKIACLLATCFFQSLKDQEKKSEEEDIKKTTQVGYKYQLKDFESLILPLSTEEFFARVCRQVLRKLPHLLEEGLPLRNLKEIMSHHPLLNDLGNFWVSVQNKISSDRALTLSGSLDPNEESQRNNFIAEKAALTKEWQQTARESAQEKAVEKKMLSLAEDFLNFKKMKTISPDQLDPFIDGYIGKVINSCQEILKDHPSSAALAQPTRNISVHEKKNGSEVSVFLSQNKEDRPLEKKSHLGKRLAVFRHKKRDDHARDDLYRPKQ